MKFGHLEVEQPQLGDLLSIAAWLLTTYKSWDDPPSRTTDSRRRMVLHETIIDTSGLRKCTNSWNHQTLQVPGKPPPPEQPYQVQYLHFRYLNFLVMECFGPFKFSYSTDKVGPEPIVINGVMGPL